MKKKKYHIITIGCQMNKSDSERIAGYLDDLDYNETDKINQADLVILTTCGVRQTAEDRVYGLIPNIKKENPEAKIILAGCLSEREDVKKRLEKKVDIWLPVKELPLLSNKLRTAPCLPCLPPGRAADRGCELQENVEHGNYLDIKPKYSSKICAFVPIGNGCDNFCTYCVVPHARGREAYRHHEEILKEIKGLINNGYKEIILIAQNVNSYKFPISNFQFPNNIKAAKNLKYINFPVLLRLINSLNGDFWIRFATSHPKDMSDDLINAVAECDKACEHIHLPAQAGDNEILKAMNRGYTLEKYKKLIDKIRKKIPGSSLTTDIIVGFPGETRKHFDNTKKLFKQIGYDMAYIARYSPRPGTAALKLKDNVSAKEKKRREAELMKILRKTALKNNRKYPDKISAVLIHGKNRKGEYYGYTRTNKNVKIKCKMQNAKCKNIIGQFKDVKIVSAKDFGLEGELIKKESPRIPE